IASKIRRFVRSPIVENAQEGGSEVSHEGCHTTVSDRLRLRAMAGTTSRTLASTYGGGKGRHPRGLRSHPLRDFAAACRTRLPLVMFTTRALRLEPIAAAASPLG